MFLLRRSFCFYHFKKLLPFGARYYPWQFSCSLLKPCFISLKSPHSPTQDNFTKVQEFLKDPLLNSISTSKDVFQVIAILLSLSTILSIYYSLQGIHQRLQEEFSNEPLQCSQIDMNFMFLSLKISALYCSGGLSHCLFKIL